MSRFTLFLSFLLLTLLCLTCFTHALTDAEQQQIADTQTLDQHIESHFTSDATTQQELEQQMEGEIEADVDVDVDVDADADADADESSLVETEAQTQVDTEQEMEAETDAELDAATLLQIDAALDAEAEAEADTEVDIESAQATAAMSEADTQADIESEAEMDAEMDALTTIDHEIDMDAEIQADLSQTETTTTLLEMEQEGQETEELDADEIALLETEMESEQDADLDSNTQLLADANFEKKYKHSKAALRYLRALSEAGTLRSARRLDRSLRQHGFLARFRNPETQICHGSMKSFTSRQATAFYGYEEKFCEAVTAQQYVDKKSHVGLNPQIKHFRAPHRALFAYTENRPAFLNSLQLINQKNGWTANWQASQATVAKKSAAVQALFAFCDFQRKYKHYPNKYAGYIERIPLDKNWLLGAAVTGVYMQNPNIQITMPILAKYLEDAVALTTTMNAREKRQFQKWIKMVAISPVSGDVQDQFAHVPNFVAGYVMEVGTCDALGTSFEDKNLTSWSPTQLDTVFQKAVSGFFSIGRRPAHLEPLVLDYLSYHLYHKTLARAGTLSPFIIRKGLKKGFRGAIQKLTRKLTPKRLEKRRYNRAIRAIRKRNLKLLRKVARSIRRAPLLDKQQKKNLRATLKTLIVLVKKGFKLTVADVVNVRKSARQLYRQFLGIIRGVKPKPRPTKPSSTTSAPTTPSTPTTVTPATSTPTTAAVTTPPTTATVITTTTSPPTIPVTPAPTVPITPTGPPTTNVPYIPVGDNSGRVIGTDPNIPIAPKLSG